MKVHMRQHYIDLLEEQQCDVRLERADAIQRVEEAIAEAAQAVQKSKEAIAAVNDCDEEMRELQAKLAEAREMLCWN